MARHKISKAWQYWLLGLATLVAMLIPGWLGYGVGGGAAHSRAQAQVVQSSSPIAAQDGLGLVQAGRDRYQQGQYGAAADLWQQASVAFAATGDRPNQAMVLSNLALAYQQLGQWSQANQAIAQSFALLKATPPASQQRILAQALTNQGSLQLAQGKPEAALETWKTATHLYQQLQLPQGVIKGLLNQVQALRSLGFYRQADERLQQARQVIQGQSNSLLKLDSLISLGDILRSVGNFPASESELLQALSLAKTLNRPADVAAVQVSLGNTVQLLPTPEATDASRATPADPVERALNYYQQASQYRPAASGTAGAAIPMVALQAQLNQLRLLARLGRSPAAQQVWQQIQPHLATLPVSRAAIYAQVNAVQSLLKLDAANAPANVELAKILARVVQQAKDLGDRRAEAYALGYLGMIYEQDNQLATAQTLTQQALQLAQVGNAPEVAYRWQWQLGRVLKAQVDQPGGKVNSYQPAIAAYSEAISTLNSIRNDLIATNLDAQFSFRESVEPVYRELVALLLQDAAQTPSASQKNLQQARQVIESLQLAELDNFFQEACLSGQPKQIDQIDPHAAVIYPIILSDRLEVVLSIPGQPLRHYASRKSATELDGLFQNMQRSLRLTSFEQERLPIAQQVYDLLIRPLEADLQQAQVKTLAFVLDGSLKNLPMAALYDGQQYLLEKYAIALTPGLQLLESRPLDRQQFQVLVGGITEENQGFPALPGVETEVQQIQASVPSNVLLNAALTDNALKKTVTTLPFPVIHLATHGQFSSDAENTFVLLWQQRLTVKQLGELLQTRSTKDQTPIELLILSACQTASGDNRAALGLAGVAVRSGARSTLATLWSVNDQSTSLFMTQLYQKLSSGQFTKAEAVRQAQLALLKQEQFNHPYYWAPFVLLGNWL